MLQLNPDWFYLLVPAHPVSPGQRAVKRVCVNIAFSECVPSGAVVMKVDVIGGLLGYIFIKIVDIVLQCFDAVGWAAGRAYGL